MVLLLPSHECTNQRAMNMDEAEKRVSEDDVNFMLLNLHLFGYRRCCLSEQEEEGEKGVLVALW